MDERKPINYEAVIIYVDGAREALEGAQYNLNGDFYGIAVYAFFLRCHGFASAPGSHPEQTFERAGYLESYLSERGYL